MQRLSCFRSATILLPVARFIIIKMMIDKNDDDGAQLIFDDNCLVYIININNDIVITNR